MALVDADLSKIGTRLEIYEDECGDDRIYGTVVKMPFYDPEGKTDENVRNKIMKDIKRVSPVKFKSAPLKTEKRDNWDIVMEYAGEGEGPYLVDLSHKPRFDLQDADVGTITPFWYYRSGFTWQKRSARRPVDQSDEQHAGVCL